MTDGRTETVAPLAEAFKATGLKNREIATKLETSEAQISRWRGGVKPLVVYQKEIVRFLNRRGIEATREELWPDD